MQESNINEKCLLCGGSPEDESHFYSNQSWTALKEECGVSLCSVLSLPDTPLRKAFAYGPYCSTCMRIILDLSFAVTRVKALQKNIRKARSLVEEKISKHHKRIRKAVSSLNEALEEEETFHGDNAALRYRAAMLKLIVKGLARNSSKEQQRWKTKNVPLDHPPFDMLEDYDHNQDMDLDSPQLIPAAVKCEVIANDFDNWMPATVPTTVGFEPNKCNKANPARPNLDPRTASLKCKKLMSTLNRNEEPEDVDVCPVNPVDHESNSDPEFMGDEENDEDEEFILSDMDTIAKVNDQQHMSTSTTKRKPKAKVKRSKAKTTETNKVRSGTGSHTCDLCPYICESQRSLVDHNRKMHHDRRFECQICKIKFRMLPTLEAHSRTYHGDGDKMFTHFCSTCKKGFNTETELEEHEKFHLSNTPFKCSVCETVFTNSKDLERHVRAHDNPFQCTQCFRSYAHEDDLNQHVKFHSRNVQCEICGLSCRTETVLKQHLQSTHNSDKLFQCHLCHLSYKYKKGLNVHLRIHTGERPFVCKICSRSFYDSGHLKKHEEIHAGVKTYICANCGKAFMTKQSLAQHERNVHLIGKPSKPRAPRPKKQSNERKARRGIEAVVVTTMTESASSLIESNPDSESEEPINI